jgi:hypothetical protein
MDAAAPAPDAAPDLSPDAAPDRAGDREPVIPTGLTDAFPDVPRH